MTNIVKCPLCNNQFSNSCTQVISNEVRFFECENCGNFRMSDCVKDDNFEGQLNEFSCYRIAYDVRRHTDQSDLTASSKFFLISQEYIDASKSNNNIPNPSEQAENLIIFLGDELNKSFEPIEHLPPNLYLKIGSRTRQHCYLVVNELYNEGYITGVSNGAHAINYNIKNPNLSLKGWEKYNLGKKGKFSGNYAFIAYQFGTQDFEPFLNKYIKPFIKDRLNFEVRDMQGHTEAGIIDNIMRQQIRDSAFVIADLTHNNNGAYWEAGYAEGLGKPVIYICNEDAFDKNGTHFDTNHCTTIMWSNDIAKLKQFEDTLCATVRRSLNLFN